MALRAGGLREILSLARITHSLRSGVVGHQDQRGNDQGVDILHVVPAFSCIFPLYRKRRLALAQIGRTLKDAILILINYQAPKLVFFASIRRCRKMRSANYGAQIFLRALALCASTVYIGGITSVAAAPVMIISYGSNNCESFTRAPLREKQMYLVWSEGYLMAQAGECPLLAQSGHSRPQGMRRGVNSSASGCRSGGPRPC